MKDRERLENCSESFKKLSTMTVKFTSNSVYLGKDYCYGQWLWLVGKWAVQTLKVLSSNPITGNILCMTCIW